MIHCLEITEAEKHERYDPAAEEYPEVLELYPEILSAADEHNSRKKLRREQSSHGNDADRGNTHAVERPAEKAHKAPKRAREQNIEGILVFHRFLRNGFVGI